MAMEPQHDLRQLSWPHDKRFDFHPALIHRRDLSHRFRTSISLRRPQPRLSGASVTFFAVARVYTPAEAAAVSQIGIKAVHNAIDKRIVDTVGGGPAPTKSVRRRGLTGEGLLRLKLWCGVGSTLAAPRRQRLFEAIEAEPAAKTVKADDLLIVDVDEARKQLKARIRDLDEAEATIGRVKGVLGGEPVFKGTRIPVRTIAAMLADDPDVADLLDGYPSLTARMIELARIWTAAHPTRGRPKKLSDQGLTIKSSKRTPLKGDPRPPRRYARLREVSRRRVPAHLSCRGRLRARS